MKIGVYVGSFNPVHIGHKSVIDFLLNNLLDKIIVVPTGSYWDKTNLIDIKHRINMLKFYENDRIIINNTLNNKEYTYEILNALEKEYLDDELFLIIGADNLPKFHLWKNIDSILEHKVIVLNRNKINLDKYIKKFVKKDNFIMFNNFNEVNVSSTFIRENLEESKNFLDKNVYEYIINNNLYVK